MPRDNSYKDYIVEDVLGHIEGITSKAMFSGHGIYLDGVIVGLIIDGEFYLKINKGTRGLGEPFQYDRNGKIVALPYALVPIDTLEDREKIQEQIYESFEVSKKNKK
jgi:DNA transformation protein